MLSDNGERLLFFSETDPLYFRHERADSGTFGSGLRQRITRSVWAAREDQRAWPRSRGSGEESSAALFSIPLTQDDFLRRFLLERRVYKLPGLVPHRRAISAGGQACARLPFGSDRRHEHHFTEPLHQARRNNRRAKGKGERVISPPFPASCNATVCLRPRYELIAPSIAPVVTKVTYVASSISPIPTKLVAIRSKFSSVR